MKFFHHVTVNIEKILELASGAQPKVVELRENGSACLENCLLQAQSIGGAHVSLLLLKLKTFKRKFINHFLGVKNFGTPLATVNAKGNRGDLGKQFQ